jgi:hypothetical protein
MNILMHLNVVTYMYWFVFYMARPVAADLLRKQFRNEQ